ncbi:MAG: tetratricopeptide repeat protein [Thermoanaerobaculia bacterium]
MPRDEGDKSATYYRRFLSLRPDHLGAHFELAQVCAKRGARDAALAELEAARALNPESRRVRNAITRLRRDAEPSG